MVQISKLLAAAFVLLSMVACAAHVPLASQTRDAEAKAFSEIPDKSKIYVVRTCAYGQRLHDASVDGGPRVSLACQTYTVFVVQPGEHTIAVASTENRELLKLQTAPGENYFIELGWRMGSGTGDVKAMVGLMDDLNGTKAIKRASLVSNEGY